MLTKETFLAAAKVPSATEVEACNIDNVPTKNIAVFLDPKDPKSILEHAVLGPVLQPFANFIFREKDGKTTLAEDKVSLPVVMKDGETKYIHLVMGGSSEEDSRNETEDYKVPKTWRDAGAKIRGVVGDIASRPESELAIYLEEHIIFNGNGATAMNALGRALGNISYIDTHYKGAKKPETHKQDAEELKTRQDITLQIRRAIQKIYIAHDDGTDNKLRERRNKNFREGDQTSRMQALVRFLAEAPHNILDCTTFVSVVHQLYAEAKEEDPNIPLTMEIWGPEEGSIEGDGITYNVFKDGELGGLRAVHKGSWNEKGPYCITLSYRGAEQKDTPVNLLVGKTVVMDNGGHCAKGAAAKDMQGDMQGGAEVAAQLAMTIDDRPNANIEFVFAVASNSADGDAYEVENIITLESEKTVRIGNTDAEGRIVVADAMAKAKKKLTARGEKIGYIPDIATMTGHAVLTTGNEAVAITSNTKIRRQLEDNARISGEPLEGMKLTDMDEKLVKDSAPDGADLYNIGMWPVGAAGNARGAQSGAAFIALAAGLTDDEKSRFVQFDIAALMNTRFATDDVSKAKFNGGAIFDTLYDFIKTEAINVE